MLKRNGFVGALGLVLGWTVSVGAAIAPGFPEVAGSLGGEFVGGGYDQKAENGPHHRVRNRSFVEVGAEDKEFLKPAQYTELATGLQFFGETTAGPGWLETEERIDLVEGGAAAERGPHKVRFAANAAAEVLVDLETSDGKRLRSRVLGLSYYDAATGKSVLLAEVKDRQGELWPPHRVVYRDAFDDVLADVVFTYTRAGLEQDIILREKPPEPEAFGLEAEMTRLEVLTEFLEAPAPEITERMVRVEKDAAARGRLLEPDLTDEHLDFGAMIMGPGRAFALEGIGAGGKGGADAVPKESILVAKRWTKMDGRTVLVEAIDYRWLKKELEGLEAPPGSRGAPSRQARLGRELPIRKMELGEFQQMANVGADYRPRGVVVDYHLTSSVADFTFKSGFTYLVRGDLYLRGTTTIETGAVVKFERGAAIFVAGQVHCAPVARGQGYFTGVDDDSVGVAILESNGRPEGLYAEAAIRGYYPSSDIRLENLDIRFAKVALDLRGYPGEEYRYVVENCRIAKGAVGIQSMGARVEERENLAAEVEVPRAESGALGSRQAAKAGAMASLQASPPGISLANATDNSFSWASGGGAAWVGHTAGSYDGVDVARSGYISHSQTTYLETTLNGPGVLGFYWRTSSEANFDYLKFRLNGVLQTQISGESGWSYGNYVLPAGAQTLRWEYVKDGSVSSGADGGWLDVVSFVPSAQLGAPSISPNGGSFTDFVSVTLASVDSNATIRYTMDGTDPSAGSPVYSGPLLVNSSRTVKARAYRSGFTESAVSSASFVITSTVSLGEAVENPSLYYTTGGQASWFGQANTGYYGGDAAQSGAIGHGQSSYLSVPATGPMTVSFYWRVSSEYYHDVLKFSINGVEQTRISGETGWAPLSYSLAAGSHTLRWEYSKDGSVASGSDAGWVDFLVLQPVTQASAPVMSPSPGTYNGQVSVGLSSGTAGASIYYTTDGTAPTTASRLYSGPFLLTVTTQVRAKAVKSGLADSPIASGFYVVNSVISLGEAVDDLGGVWSSPGSAPWFGQTAIRYSGGDAAQSGLVAHYQGTGLNRTVTGPGTVRFFWKVSSETAFDHLKFYINGVEYNRISGEVDWFNQSYPVPSGTHSLVWEYRKDGVVSVGYDAGWVDAFSFTPQATPPVIGYINNQVINEDGSTGPIPFTISDLETPLNQLSVSASSSQTALVPSSGIILGGANGNRTISLTPAPNRSGTTTITITVNDGTHSVNGYFLLTVNPVNDAPVVSLSAASFSYMALSPPAVIDANGVLTDIDSPSLHGGSIRVDFTANGHADDRLGIRNQGSAPGQVGAAPGLVFYEGLQVGTYAGGVGTAPLVISLRGGVTPAIGQAILRNITFSNISYNPSLAPRGLRVVVYDDVGGASAPAIKTLQLTSDPLTDLDLDGMPDNWERQYFGNLQQAALGDYDADLISNLQEFRAGSHPSSGLGLQIFTLLE